MRRKPVLRHPDLETPHPERPTRATAASTFRLPTVAAIVSAFAALAVTPSANAVIVTGSDAATDSMTDGADEARDRGDAGDDAGDAFVAPPYDVPQLGGVPPPTRVHGTGCGCGSEGGEQGTASAITTSVTALALVLSTRRRRRGCSPAEEDRRRSSPDRSR